MSLISKGPGGGGAGSKLYVWEKWETVEVPIVDWATGSNSDVEAMLTAHDNGYINLADYWSVGDERTVHLSAMEAIGVGESHTEQDVTFVLMNKGGKILSDGVTECAFIVGMKNCLLETGHISSVSYYTGGWSGCSRETWCNNVFRNAIPEYLRTHFKRHKNVGANKSGSGAYAVTVFDYFALASDKEILGNTGNADATIEANLAQFEYYKTSSNRSKKLGDNGSSVDYWSRSPYTSTSGYWCKLLSLYASPNLNYGISPFGVI